MPSIQASTSELIIHTALWLLERCRNFSTCYSSPEYDCCSPSSASRARGSESEGELCPAHPAAKKEPPPGQSVNSTEWNSFSRKGRWAHLISCRYGHLLGSVAAFSRCFLLPCSNIICPFLLCADHLHNTVIFVGSAMSWSALLLSSLALIWGEWCTSHLTAHPLESPHQVMCSYFSYHVIFHAVVIYTDFHSPLEGFMAIRYCQVTSFNLQKVYTFPY